MFAAQVSSSASSVLRRNPLRIGPVEIGAYATLSIIWVLVIFF